MTSKFNLIGLASSQQSERYITIKYRLAEITLKFNLAGSNFQKFPVIRREYSH